MSIEVLSILANKTNYERYYKYISEHSIDTETKTILEDLGEYYELNPTITDVDWEKFSDWFKLVKHTMFKSEKIDIYNKIFINIMSVSLEETDINILLRSFIERDYASQIADIALRTADGEISGKLSELSVLVDKYESDAGVLTNTTEDEVTDTFEEIFESFTLGTGLNWRIEFLNKSLGPLRKGNLIIFGKRPETGGTTFCASEATHMAPQLEADEKVLWFNNEQPGREVKARLLEAGLGWDSTRIMADITTAVQEYDKLVGDKKIIVVEAHGKDVKWIEQKLKQYKVGLIIFDQLWKVRGFDRNGTDAQRLTDIFAWSRVLAHTYCPVVAVHQVDGSAGKYIPMELLYGSKTGVPGEADAIITMGRSSEAGEEHKRYINIPKNKLFGGKSTDRTLRHGKCELEILPDIGRFRE